jgi:hypothetical protein
MASSDARDSSNSITSNVAKVTRLIAHLARNDTTALSVVLGSAIMALLNKLGADVTSQTALAYFVVSMHGERGALRRQDVRELLLLKLESSEAAELCNVLQLPIVAPHRTLNAIDFDAAPSFLEHLDRWYGVETDELAETSETTYGSQKAVASHKLSLHQLNGFRKLRRAIGCPPTSILVHMPFGAGKLRLVATAALDLYRSEADDRSIVWFAPGVAMCEEAFMELQNVWRQLGSRDATILQLYGNHPVRDLDQLQGAIAIIDIHSVNSDDAALVSLGAVTSVVIFGDAENRVHPFGAAIAKRMSTGGSFSTVGILATPADAMDVDPTQIRLAQAFPHTCISMQHDEDFFSLRRVRNFTNIVGTVIHLTDPLDTNATEASVTEVHNDSLLDFDQSYIDELSNNVLRNERLLSILEQESKSQGRVIFFATTAEQARLFAGLLPVHGIKARAVTADESPAKRSLFVQRFVAQDEKVLCLHGFLFVGSSIPDISVCLIATPTKSRSAMISTIGRLVEARDSNLAALKLIVAADSQADVGWVEVLNTWSTLNSKDFR